MAPDFEYLGVRVGTFPRVGFSHTTLGQFVFCLPITLALVLVIGHLRLGEVLVARMGPLRARSAWLASAASDVTCHGGVVRAAVCALIGSFSHIVFDAITHTTIPAWLPVRAVRVAGVHVYAATGAQLAATVLGAAVSIVCLVRLARIGAGAPVPLARRGGALVVVLGAAGAVMAVLHALPVLLHPDAYFDAGRVYVWGFGAFVAAAGAGVGVLLAGVLLAYADRRERVAATPSPG
jgi:hypothetical protein